MKALVLVFAMIAYCSGGAFAADLTIVWDGGTISYRYTKAVRIYQVPPDPRKVRIRNSSFQPIIVDCAFEASKSMCWKLRPARTHDVYGLNMRFVQPIALLPHILPLGEDDPVNDESPETPMEKRVEKLPPFVVELLPAQVDRILDHKFMLGSSVGKNALTNVNETLGGAYALTTWQQQVGKEAPRECSADDSCGVVVSGTYNGAEALAYCEILKSSIGSGTPYNCLVVALKAQTGWRILSIYSPEECDGCGAASGGSCSFKTTRSIQDVTDLLVDKFKSGRTNIKLTILRQNESEISLAGRNIAMPSKFFSGYYDKSYASYRVSTSDGLTLIEGLFNLLISVEQSKEGVDYREFGGRHAEADVEWFQQQVLDIIKKDVISPIGQNTWCVMQPLGE